MWDDVGVVHLCSGFDRNVSELFNICIKANRLWEAARGSIVRGEKRGGSAARRGHGRRRALKSDLRGFAYVVSASEEEEEGIARGGSAKEQDSNNDELDSNNSLVMARV
jgi:hypothetical protein